MFIVLYLTGRSKREEGEGGGGAGGQEELHFRVEAGEGHDRRLRWLALINQKHWQTQRNSVHA